jgi:hypothetical protein
MTHLRVNHLINHFKSGQRLSLQNRPTKWAVRDYIVLPYRLRGRQVRFGPPAQRTATVTFVDPNRLPELAVTVTE